MSTNELILQNQQEIDAYLADLDKKQEQDNSWWLTFNEIRIISSDKVQDELWGKPKGWFFIRQKLEDWTYHNSYLWNRCEWVILKNTSQYVYYDAIENKIAYVTNEFEKWIEDRISVYSHIQKETVFVGNQAEFKAWALKHHPNGVSNDWNPKHMFKWRTVYYIAIPALFEKNWVEKSVFRLYLWVKDLDSIKDFNNALTAAPIRFLIEMTTSVKDVWTNRMFPIVFKIIKENSRELLVTLINAKIELDKVIKNYTWSLLDWVTVKQDLWLLWEWVSNELVVPKDTEIPTMPNAPVIPVQNTTTYQKPISQSAQAQARANIDNMWVSEEDLNAIFD